MARVKVLLLTMSVLTLFIMCGGCEREGRERRDDGDRDRQLQSERERSDQHRDKNTESHEERHEEQK
jgi:hypothetical protein